MNEPGLRDLPLESQPRQQSSSIPSWPLNATIRAGSRVHRVSPAGPLVPSEVGTGDPSVPMALPTPLVQPLRCPLPPCPPHIYPALYNLQRALPSISQCDSHVSPEHGFSLLESLRPRLRLNNIGWRREEHPHHPDTKLGPRSVPPYLYRQLSAEQHRQTQC